MTWPQSKQEDELFLLQGSGRLRSQHKKACACSCHRPRSRRRRPRRMRRGTGDQKRAERKRAARRKRARTSREHRKAEFLLSRMGHPRRWFQCTHPHALIGDIPPIRQTWTCRPLASHHMNQGCGLARPHRGLGKRHHGRDNRHPGRGNCCGWQGGTAQHQLSGNRGTACMAPRAGLRHPRAPLRSRAQSIPTVRAPGVRQPSLLNHTMIQRSWPSSHSWLHKRTQRA